MQGGHLEQVLVFDCLFAQIFPKYLTGLNFSDVPQGSE